MAIASRGRRVPQAGRFPGAAGVAVTCLLLVGLLGTAEAEEKRLNVYNWADFIGTRTLQRFERQTGIKVVYDTCDAEETMEAKLLAGGSGHDVVSASTNFFSRQIKAGVYRPLDKSKLPNWKNLDPKVLALQLPVDPAIYPNENVKARLYATEEMDMATQRARTRTWTRITTGT